MAAPASPSGKETPRSKGCSISSRNPPLRLPHSWSTTMWASVPRWTRSRPRSPTFEPSNNPIIRSTLRCLAVAHPVQDRRACQVALLLIPSHTVATLLFASERREDADPILLGLDDCNTDSDPGRVGFASCAEACARGTDDGRPCRFRSRHPADPLEHLLRMPRSEEDEGAAAP